MTSDWREHLRWRRSQLERELKDAVERGARRVLIGATTGLPILEIRRIKSELHVLDILEAQAEEMESGDLW